MRTLVVNLFGGPGAGKSTLAAGVFSKLKLLGVNCELVTEFAKDLTWEGRTDLLARNQVLLLGEQFERMDRLTGQVDVIVTDSPILLSRLYNNRFQYLDELTDELWNYFDNINYVVERTKPYNPIGRNQTETEAQQLDDAIKCILHSYKECRVEQADIVAAEVYLEVVKRKGIA